MFLTRRRAAFAPVLAALAVAAPATSASAAAVPAGDPVVTGPSCPAGYAGPTNLATGCPYWIMTYTVTYPGQPSFHCPVNWSPAAGSVGRLPGTCGSVAAGN
jgi:hypothetical protein